MRQPAAACVACAADAWVVHVTLGAVTPPVVVLLAAVVAVLLMGVVAVLLLGGLKLPSLALACWCALARMAALSIALAAALRYCCPRRYCCPNLDLCRSQRTLDAGSGCEGGSDGGVCLAEPFCEADTFLFVLLPWGLLRVTRRRRVKRRRRHIIARSTIKVAGRSPGGHTLPSDPHGPSCPSGRRTRTMPTTPVTTESVVAPRGAQSSLNQSRSSNPCVELT